MVYKPRKWFTCFRIMCLLSICIMISGISIEFEQEYISIKNENLDKNLEKKPEIEKKSINDTVIADIHDVVEQVVVDELTPDNAAKYMSVPERGFNVTTNNRVYELSDLDFILVTAVIATEANKNSIDDVLAVASVVLNRADGKGVSPVEVVTAPGQFTGYLADHYWRYIDAHGNLTNLSEEVINTVKDALSGIRNNTFYSFRSWSTTGYSENYIIEYGNRYN